MANGLPNSTLLEASNHRDAVTTGLSSTSFRVTSVDARRFSLLAAAIFAIIAALQFVRALYAWPITLDTFSSSCVGELGGRRRVFTACVVRLFSLQGLTIWPSILAKHVLLLTNRQLPHPLFG